MPSIGLDVVHARAQGVLAATAVCGGSVAFGLLFGRELIGIPGLVVPIPVVRVFPAVLAAGGALVLLEPWREFELTGAWPVLAHRAYRFGLAVVAVGCAGRALAAHSQTPVLLHLTLLLFCAVTLLLGVVGKHWWLAIAGALYGQLFLQELEEFRPGVGWVVAALVLASAFYLWRGEATLGRSPT